MKNHSHTILIALALTLPFATYAEEKAARVPSKPTGLVVIAGDPAVEQREFKGPITVVNREDKSITVNDPGSGTLKLQIGDTTKLTRGDKAATWDDLKVGAKVNGTCRGSATKAHAETVNING